MRICVTGASGYLGSRLCPKLVKLGYELTCVDIVQPKEKYGTFRRADIIDENETYSALEEAELLIHCASIHPWKEYKDEQYIDTNVKGTWNVFNAASEQGIERIILTSSIAASGYNPDPKLCPVDESYQHPSLSDIYSLTKLFQEQIARHFCGRKGMKVIALRPPNFTPKSPIQTGVSLLSGCLVVEDVASAHIKALDVFQKLQDNFEPFYITQTFPYSPEEARKLLTEPKMVVEKYFPGAWDWFKEVGVALHPSPTIYDNSKAKRILDWQPEYTFARWFDEYRKKDPETLL